MTIGAQLSPNLDRGQAAPYIPASPCATQPYWPGTSRDGPVSRFSIL